MATPAPLSACALEGSELLARIHAWQQVTNRATSRRVEGARIVATYPNDAQLLGQLRELIAAEAACCSFLEFNVEEMADSVVTELRFSEETPAAMRTMLLELIGASE
jgi:hypothetical protein